MTKQHPSFSFAGMIPVEVTVLPVEDLRKALDEHEANCPGTYQECCTDGRGNLKTGPLERLYRKWASKKCDIKARLELAERMAEHPSPTTVKPAPKAKPRPENTPSRRSLEGKIASYNKTLEQLREMGSDDPRWTMSRHNLATKRKGIMRAAREAGVKVELGTIPRKPIKLKRKPFHKGAA